ncbi:MAG: biotin/lipoate A/B protein ligase family protein [Candidatus Promineifilaceae bacterium]
MDLYNLGTVPWRDSQLLYHALAHLGREGLILLQPGNPYVCLGYHQDAERELELDFLEENQIPAFRREVGGGAVYLDRGQLFYQLILRSDREDVPASKDAFYRKFLGPVVKTFCDAGVDAIFKPVNDIIVDGRKISGNGAAEINGMVILVGNFLIDFNYEMMARSLRVPSEKFRDKVKKSMREALTTLTRELETPPSLEMLSERVIENYEPLLGSLVQREVDDEMRAMTDQLWREQFGRPDWLMVNDRRRPDLRRPALRGVRIAEGVDVIERVYKAPGGLIRASAVQDNGTLRDVHYSGDFFIYPADALLALEAALEGVTAEYAPIEARINDFYRVNEPQTPGITAADFASALLD